MYKAIVDFKDILKDRHEYKAGDAYQEISKKWTDFLVETGKIQKVVIEKKKLFGKDEDVAEK